MQYKISELAEKANVTKRTIHFYISKGLLLPPDGKGVNSLYNDSHLERLLLIKKLQNDFMPLNKIREYILENPSVKTGCSIVSDGIKPKIEMQENMYFRENVCDIFEMHYSQENAEKYKYIIENVKIYVMKMLED